MRVIPVLIAMLLTSIDAFNQSPLVFTELGSYPSECRLFGHQNGNGVVFGSASGGSPGFNYTWTNIQTGATSPNTTWGGLLPGTYELKVMDSAGDSLIGTVVVDSITPISNFSVGGPGMSSITAGYIGFAPVNATLHNLSQYSSVGWYDPTTGGTFSWQFESGGPFDVSLDSTYSPTHYYASGGTYTATLIVQNKNGCADTTSKQIGLFDLTNTDELSNGFFTLEAYSTGQIVFKKTNHFNAVTFKMFDLSGKLVLEKEILDQLSFISHTQKPGMYLYQLIDHGNSSNVSGKILIK